MFTLKCKIGTDLVSDHTGFAINILRNITLNSSLVQTPGVSASSKVTSFKIGRTVLSNSFIIHNALDILHRLIPDIEHFSKVPSIGLTVLSLCVYSAFRAG